MNQTLVKITSALLLTAMLIAPISPAGSSAMTMTASAQDSDIDRGTPTRSSSSATGFETSKTYSFSKMQKKITEAQATNKDVKAWLTIPNTNINYPVLFSGKDNAYYAYRDWQGTNYPNTTWQNFKVTATYVDFRTKWGDTWNKTSKNTVLYGHNWTNLRTPVDVGNVSKHTMFGQLPSYTDKTFAKDNPYIYYSTGENEGIWKVFAVAYCELDAKFFYNSPNPNTESYQKLLNEWKARTMYDFDVDVATTDRILTLSTCTRQYDKGANQRFVVVARLLRDGESENDKVKVTINEDMKKPQF